MTINEALDKATGWQSTMAEKVLAAEVERLRADLAHCEHTADGAVLYPGKLVWHDAWARSVGWHSAESRVIEMGCGWCRLAGIDHNTQNSEVWSTWEAAAEAAKEER
jgi:hypothetical protein